MNAWAGVLLLLEMEQKVLEGSPKETPPKTVNEVRKLMDS
jgi:hypothetical protein